MDGQSHNAQCGFCWKRKFKSYLHHFPIISLILPPSFHVFSTTTTKSVLPAAIEKAATGIDDAVLLCYYSPVFFQIISKLLHINQHIIWTDAEIAGCDLFPPTNHLHCYIRTENDANLLHLYSLAWISQLMDFQAFQSKIRLSFCSNLWIYFTNWHPNVTIEVNNTWIRSPEHNMLDVLCKFGLTCNSTHWFFKI